MGTLVIGLAGKYMIRGYCYGTDCEEDHCRCHDEDIKNEVNLEKKMKVKDLAKQLEALNPEIEILVSGDSEGNDYKTIDCIRVDTKYYVIYPTDEIIETF